MRKKTKCNWDCDNCKFTDCKRSDSDIQIHRGSLHLQRPNARPYKYAGWTEQDYLKAIADTKDEKDRWKFYSALNRYRVRMEVKNG